MVTYNDWVCVVSKREVIDTQIIKAQREAGVKDEIIYDEIKVWIPAIISVDE